MDDLKRTKRELIAELNQLRRRVAHLETLDLQNREWLGSLGEEGVSLGRFLESVVEGVVLVDEVGRIVSVNSRVEQLFGLAREELVGHPLGVLMPERHRERHKAYVRRYFEEPWLRPMGQHIDMIGLHKSGREFPLEISLSYLRLQTGTLAIAFINDITDRKRYEEELRARNEDLDAFAHTVAHDLKNPLTLMVGYAHLILDEEERADINTYAQRIMDSGQKMQQIIDEMLFLASARQEDVNLSPLDIEQLVLEALKRLAPTIAEKNAEVVLPERWPTAWGYAPWVEEVWVNYISNGLKYGGAPPRLVLDAHVFPNGWVRYCVRDNGPGLTPEEQARLFRSFERLDQVRATGHGLGLSIVRRIVEKMGGGVGVESKIGGGSIFSFTLPGGRVSPQTVIGRE
jgi:PAS domain S-box-containing protein